jgi:hypothetical protein
MDGEWVVDPSTQEELWVPVWANASDARTHAELKRSGRLRTIRMYPDTTSESVLWESHDGDVDPIDYSELHLDLALQDALRDWSGRWRAFHAAGDGWKQTRSADIWANEGEGLREAVAKAVWPQWEVVNEFAGR